VENLALPYQLAVVVADSVTSSVTICLLWDAKWRPDPSQMMLIPLLLRRTGLQGFAFRFGC